jgi:hypothetical protein
MATREYTLANTSEPWKVTFMLDYLIKRIWGGDIRLPPLDNNPRLYFLTNSTILKYGGDINTFSLTNSNVNLIEKTKNKLSAGLQLPLFER